jgi:hypothetical protein
MASDRNEINRRTAMKLLGAGGLAVLASNEAAFSEPLPSHNAFDSPSTMRPLDSALREKQAWYAQDMVRVGREGCFCWVFVRGEEIRRHLDIISDPDMLLPQVHEFALQLAHNLASSLIDEPILRSDVPSGISLVVNRQDKRHVIHLLNNMLDPILFSDTRRGLVTLSNLSLP